MVPRTSDTETDKGRQHVYSGKHAAISFSLPSLLNHRSDMLSLYSQFPGFNLQFRVKLTTKSDTRGRLIGLRGFVHAVGDIELATRIYIAAYNSRGDKFTRRLRRGYCFTFYAR